MLIRHVNISFFDKDVPPSFENVLFLIFGTCLVEQFGQNVWENLVTFKKLIWQIMTPGRASNSLLGNPFELLRLGEARFVMAECVFPG